MRATEKHLRQQIRDLKDELEEIKADRERFRTYWANRFRMFVTLLSKGETVSTAWMIENMAQFLNSVEKWWW